MKLSDKVCSYEQAKRLRELGVHWQAEYKWIDRDTPILGKVDAFHNDDFANKDGSMRYMFYLAYDVAELGVMLDCNKISYYRINHMTCTGGLQYGKLACNFEGDCMCGIEQKLILGETEAQARAAMLIYLLESGIVTPEEINKRGAQ